MHGSVLPPIPNPEPLILTRGSGDDRPRSCEINGGAVAGDRDLNGNGRTLIEMIQAAVFAVGDRSQRQLHLVRLRGQYDACTPARPAMKSNALTSSRSRLTPVLLAATSAATSARLSRTERLG